MNLDDLTVKQIKKLGFRPLKAQHKNANGPDIWAIKNDKPYSFEIKKCRITRRKSVQVPPVEPARRNDDFICILHPTGYVLIEPMSDHLKCCTAKGYRTLWL